MALKKATQSIISKKGILDILGEAGKDPTLQTLLLSNLITIYLAVTQGWSFNEILLVYYTQSIIIGFFAAGKLIYYYDTPERRKRIDAAIGFLAVYGFFHAVYAAFLTEIFTPQNIIHALPFTIIFFVNHAYSFYTFYPRSPNEFLKNEYKNNTEFLKKNKYYRQVLERIVPMHVTIMLIATASSLNRFTPISMTPVLVLFLLLKTYIDARAHVIEHNKTTKPFF